MNETHLSSAVRERANRLLAKVRHRQLMTARNGQLRSSANYARLVQRIHRGVPVG